MRGMSAHWTFENVNGSRVVRTLWRPAGATTLDETRRGTPAAAEVVALHARPSQAA